MRLTSATRCKVGHRVSRCNAHMQARTRFRLGLQNAHGETQFSKDGVWIPSLCAGKQQGSGDCPDRLRPVSKFDLAVVHQARCRSARISHRIFYSIIIVNRQAHFFSSRLFLNRLLSAFLRRSIRRCCDLCRPQPFLHRRLSCC